jgi:hypothetical protein
MAGAGTGCTAIAGIDGGHSGTHIDAVAGDMDATMRGGD